MPYKTEKEKLGSAFLKRSAKLLPCQKERIRRLYKKDSISHRFLAKFFNVSRRTIQFTLDKSKLEQNKKRRKERGGSKQYYDKDYHNEKMREYRNYKHKTLS